MVLNYNILVGCPCDTRVKVFKRTLSQNVFRACDFEVKLQIQYINRINDKLKRLGKFLTANVTRNYFCLSVSARFDRYINILTKEGVAESPAQR